LLATATSNLFTLDLQPGFADKGDKNKEILKKLKRKGETLEKE
jgi:hypothetical protein